MTDKGKYTTEFWMAAISKIVAVVFPLLLAYGVLDMEKGELWAGLILAIASIVIPLVNGKVDATYIENRTAIKMEGITLEREAVALESARLEAMR